MEPPSAQPRASRRGCEVWVGIQNAEAIRTDLSQALGMPIDKVTVNYRCWAAALAASPSPTSPSKRRSAPRPWAAAGQGHLDPRGRPAAQLLPHRVGGAPGSGRRCQRQAGGLAASHRGADHPLRSSCRGRSTRCRWSSPWALVNKPFDIPNIRVENPEAAAHTRIGWFRSVSNIPHAFAIQCFVAGAGGVARDGIPRTSCSS